MTSRPQDNKEKERINEAWQQLVPKLETETMSPKWAAWASSQLDQKQSNEMEIEQDNPTNTDQMRGEIRVMQINEEQQNPLETNGTSKSKRKKVKQRRASKWITGACAAAIVGVMVATPLGDKALAAILNQFRMEEVTSVDEGELMNLFDNVSEGAKVDEFINKYGTFTSEFGEYIKTENKTVEQVADMIGLQAVTDERIEKYDYGVGATQTITMKLDISKVNETMKRLGADDLMPESLDGKAIAFELPPALYQSYVTEDEEKRASISQQKIPTVSVDSSVDLEDAVKAVLNFPLMPDRLKTSIQVEQILSGKLPMPVVTDGSAEKISVDGISVILEVSSYNNYHSSTGNIEEIKTYMATWTKDGVLYHLNGDTLFDTKEKMIEQIKELMNR